jgi:hypothetical protein
VEAHNYDHDKSFKRAAMELNIEERNREQDIMRNVYEI